MIAIIIPTKSNIDMLFKCLLSIKQYTSVTYKLYIADTGSSIEEKEKLRVFLYTNFENNYKLIEYDYYNYAKINNDVIKNKLDNDIDFLVFCNNDIILTSDVIDQMYFAYDKFNKQSINVGTIGCRLLYENGKIQHDGQFVKDNYTNIQISHNNLNNDISCYTNTDFTKVTGNTFALCMINRKLFEDLGMLNEQYKCCFEDVEFNLKCIKNKCINFLLPTKFTAIHLESYTRRNTEYHFDKSDYILLLTYIRERFMK